LNYLDGIAAQVRAASPPSTLPEADAQALFRLYAVLVLIKGERTGAADVHHAWSAWKAERDPLDEDIRPFQELDEATRAADEPFATAIREVATRISTEQHP
jgi:hypothetical protein